MQKAHYLGVRQKFGPFPYAQVFFCGARKERTGEKQGGKEDEREGKGEGEGGYSLLGYSRLACLSHAAIDRCASLSRRRGSVGVR